jgi:ribose transport system substrate-binding protein
MSCKRKYRRMSLAVLLAGSCLLGASATAQDRPPGLTSPVVLPPFDPLAPACAAPTGLEKSLGFAKDNTRAFIEGIGHGLAEAADDRGLAYEAAVADNDASLQARQIRDFVARRFGGVVTHPVDPASVATALQDVIWSGASVGTVVSPPGTTILNAPQFLTGKVLADDAARFIEERLGGRASVVLLTQDSMQFLAARFVAIRDTLAAMPGVSIVADISPNPVTEQGGYETMKLVLEAHPDVDVVLGADSVVLGALRALREAGKVRPDQYLGGIDGEPAAIDEIRGGDGPYRSSVSLSSPMIGYALGSFAADWLEGKSIPQAVDILPIALTAEALTQYEADLVDPGAVYADATRRDSYLKMYGNICYDTRADYVNFPWSSEAAAK